MKGGRKGQRVDDLPASKPPGFGDALRRMLDGRGEQRDAPASQTAMLDHQGRRHVVRLVNLSHSGAMISYQGALADGDEVTLHLLDHGPLTGQVRWSRDGRAGINFSLPLEGDLDHQ